MAPARELRVRACLTLWIVLLACVAGAAAEPARPADDATVLERLPQAGDPEIRELRRARRELARDPTDLERAVSLAWRYRELGRIGGDPRYYGYAQSVLGPWWDGPDPPPQVLLLRATLRQAQHDFQGALRDLSRLLERTPRNAQAWLIRATVLQVIGQPDEAVRSCLPLTRLASELVAATCLSGASSLRGEAEASYRRLLDVARRDLSSASEAEQVWVLTTLAGIAVRLGHDAAAEEHFRAARTVRADDAFLLGSYADFLLDRGRAREVPDLLRDGASVDGILLRLALADRALGSPHLATRVSALRARFEASRRRGDRTHVQLLARFTLAFADAPREALALALENWAVHREPPDARLVLEAALAAGDSAAARPVVDWIAQTRLEDVRLAPLLRRLAASTP